MTVRAFIKRSPPLYALARRVAPLVYSGRQRWKAIYGPTPNEKLACKKAALRYGVSPAIHPKDWIFWYLHLVLKGSPGIENYFDDGADFARKLRSLAGERPGRLLEFAAGYGRVTRHLANVMPETEVTACDIHPAAVAFLREELGVRAVGSSDLPEQFDLGERFDVVFALSFFTHMPQATWRDWLLALARHTCPNGLLIFTTHGERVRPVAGNPAIHPDGFWFKPYSEQCDIPSRLYGTTITLPHYVRHQIASIPNMELARFEEAFLGNQDLYVLRRSRQSSVGL